MLSFLIDPGEFSSGFGTAENVVHFRVRLSRRRQHYAAFAHRGGHLWHCGFDDRTAIDLAEGEWELVSFAPVENGFAALGLADKFNGTRAISSRMWQQGECHLSPVTEEALWDGRPKNH